MRRKTNIVHLHDCKQTPCKFWLKQFKKGQIDAHEAFKRYGEQYYWLYENTDVDLIGWEIENGVFNWKIYSWAVAQFCPQHFDAKKYNWKEYSQYIAQYCPERLDPARFNWKKHSWAVAQYCPEHLDAERFNWKKFSYLVEKYCPHLLTLKS